MKGFQITRSPMRLSVLAVVLLTRSADCLHASRRCVLLGAGAALSPAAAHASRRDELLGGMGNGCTFGEGDRCAELAEGNELILKLQAKSRENREKNERELYEKTISMLGYDDFFTTVDKALVQNADGSYSALTMEEYSAARKAGKVATGSVDRIKE